MGVGVGEAALSPAAYSLLADSFHKKRLGRALSVYYAGGGVGAGIAFLAGGGVDQRYFGMAGLSATRWRSAHMAGCIFHRGVTRHPDRAIALAV